MHELSIAVSIVDAAAQEAARRGASQVRAVHLKLGPLSGVVKDALLFSYGIACEGTSLAGSRLLIEDVPVVAYCPQCRAQQTIESIQRFACPDCGSLTPDVVQGDELLVTALEIEQ
jgi:hydrogenase nickel incorporation protein HypA/HybF